LLVTVSGAPVMYLGALQLTQSAQEVFNYS